jgi:pyruvate formate-lyase activating enzyme-like uncharacterized protein
MHILCNILQKSYANSMQILANPVQIREHSANMMQILDTQILSNPSNSCPNATQILVKLRKLLFKSFVNSSKGYANARKSRATQHTLFKIQANPLSFLANPVQILCK